MAFRGRAGRSIVAPKKAVARESKPHRGAEADRLIGQLVTNVRKASPAPSAPGGVGAGDEAGLSADLGPSDIADK